MKIKTALGQHITLLIFIAIHWFCVCVFFSFFLACLHMYALLLWPTDIPKWELKPTALRTNVTIHP